MGRKDPRVTAHIARAAHFARRILRRLRAAGIGALVWMLGRRRALGT